MFKNKLVLSLFILAVGGCGVHVGNGLRKYQSPLGFEVTYNETLNLRESADKKTVTISDNKNPDARARSNETFDYSFARFSVRPDQRAGSVGQLQAVAQRDFSARTFEPVTTNASIGIRSVSESGGRLSGLYYFTTTKSEVVQLEISAKLESKKLFVPIADSYKGGGNANVVARFVPRAPVVALHEVVDIEFPAAFAAPKVFPLPLAAPGKEERPTARTFEFASGLVVTAELVRHRPDYWTLFGNMGHAEKVPAFRDRAALMRKGVAVVRGLETQFVAYLIRATDTLDLYYSASELENPERGEDLGLFTGGLKFKHPVTESKMDKLVLPVPRAHPVVPLTE